MLGLYVPLSRILALNASMFSLFLCILFVCHCNALNISNDLFGENDNQSFSSQLTLLENTSDTVDHSSTDNSNDLCVSQLIPTPPQNEGSAQTKCIKSIPHFYYVRPNSLLRILCNSKNIPPTDIIFRVGVLDDLNYEANAVYWYPSSPEITIYNSTAAVLVVNATRDLFDGPMEFQCKVSENFSSTDVEENGSWRPGVIKIAHDPVNETLGFHCWFERGPDVYCEWHSYVNVTYGYRVPLSCVFVDGACYLPNQKGRYLQPAITPCRNLEGESCLSVGPVRCPSVTCLFNVTIVGVFQNYSFSYETAHYDSWYSYRPAEPVEVERIVRSTSVVFFMRRERSINHPAYRIAYWNEWDGVIVERRASLIGLRGITRSGDVVSFPEGDISKLNLARFLSQNLVLMLSVDNLEPFTTYNYSFSSRPMGINSTIEVGYWSDWNTPRLFKTGSSVPLRSPLFHRGAYYLDDSERMLMWEPLTKRYSGDKDPPIYIVEGRKPYGEWLELSRLDWLHSGVLLSSDISEITITAKNRLGPSSNVTHISFTSQDAAAPKPRHVSYVPVTSGEFLLRAKRSVNGISTLRRYYNVKWSHPSVGYEKVKNYLVFWCYRLSDNRCDTKGRIGHKEATNDKQELRLLVNEANVLFGVAAITWDGYSSGIVIGGNLKEAELKAMLAGVVVSGFLFFVALIFLVLCVHRQKKKMRRNELENIVCGVEYSNHLLLRNSPQFDNSGLPLMECQNEIQGDARHSSQSVLNPIMDTSSHGEETSLFYGGFRSERLEDVTFLRNNMTMGMISGDFRSGHTVMTDLPDMSINRMTHLQSGGVLETNVDDVESEVFRVFSIDQAQNTESLADNTNERSFNDNVSKDPPFLSDSFYVVLPNGRRGVLSTQDSVDCHFSEESSYTTFPGMLHEFPITSEKSDSLIHPERFNNFSHTSGEEISTVLPIVNSDINNCSSENITEVEILEDDESGPILDISLISPKNDSSCIEIPPHIIDGNVDNVRNSSFNDVSMKHVNILIDNFHLVSAGDGDSNSLKSENLEELVNSNSINVLSNSEEALTLSVPYTMSSSYTPTDHLHALSSPFSGRSPSSSPCSWLDQDLEAFSTARKPNLGILSYVKDRFDSSVY